MSLSTLVTGVSFVSYYGMIFTKATIYWFLGVKTTEQHIQEQLAHLEKEIALMREEREESFVKITEEESNVAKKLLDESLGAAKQKACSGPQSQCCADVVS